MIPQEKKEAMSKQKPQGAEMPPRICVDTAVDGLLSNTGLVWIRAYHEKEFDKENDYLYLSEQEHSAQITSLEAMLERMAVSEEFVLAIITEWKHAWMDVKGTDAKDRENYSRRAFGVDANMQYDLAKRIREALAASAKGV